MNFPDNGIPTLSAWQEFTTTPVYQELARSSQDFTQERYADFKEYHRFGVRDAFTLFGRDWEYAFVWHHLQKKARENPQSFRVLDAGCGFSFFPFHVAKALPQAQVIGVDMDPTLPKYYGEKGAGKPEIMLTDIRKLPFPDKSFDAIYCISVLEHTTQYPVIADEFHRLLKPGGLMIITFDISLDGLMDLSQEAAKEFLATLIGKFSSLTEKTDFLKALTNQNGLLTTKFMKNHARDRLPWTFPMLSALKASWQKKKFGLSINSTFCCLALNK